MFTTYGKVVSSRRSSLWRTAWLLTGDIHKAGDLLQTELLKAWRRWDNVSRDGSVERYVRRTLVTTCTDRWRRRWRGEIATARLPDPTSHRRCGSRRPRHDVMAARGRLTRGQRAVVVLRYFNDLTDADGRGTRLQCRYGEKPDVACHGGLALLADASAG